MLKNPVYLGGNAAMKAFIEKQKQYPKEAIENKISGVVLLRIDINHLGKVVQSKVLSGIGHGCDEEALRISKLLVFEVEKVRGLKVLWHKKIRIQFSLPRKRNKPQGLQVKYSLVSKSKIVNNENSEKKGRSGYVITIKGK